MANYETLKAAIQDVIKTNGNNEITGVLMQQSLLSMINSLGVGFQYAGIATPATNPGTPDQNVFYFASTVGTYTNFGGLVLNDGEIAILKYNGAWSKDSTGAASSETVNDLQKQINEVDRKVDAAEYEKQDAAESGAGELSGAVGSLISKTSNTSYRWFKVYGNPGDVFFLDLYRRNETSWWVYYVDENDVIVARDLSSSPTNYGWTEKYRAVIPEGASAMYFQSYNNSAHPLSTAACYTGISLQHEISNLQEQVNDVHGEIWEKFSYKNLERTFTAPGYLLLSRTIKAGTYCKVTIDLSAWNAYTNIVAYTAQGGAHETIKGATYTFNGVVEFTPTIDVNYIRINSSVPGSGASGSILIRSAVNYTDRIDFDAVVKQMDDIIYIGQPIEVSGISGYTAIGSTLLAGHKYRIDYAIHNYGNRFYYAELYSDPSGGVSAGVIVSGSALSNIEGTAEITLTRNAQSIRIGVGGGTLPADAQATFTIREVLQFADKIYVDGKVAEVENQLSSGYAVLADFFDEEMQNTIDSVNALTNQRCLVMPIVTDSHWRWTTETGNNVKKRSINNVRYFCERVYADGVSHLGDILDTEVIGTTTDDELYDLMQQYLMSLASSNRHFYAANGNHDGARLSHFNEMKWYGIIGRATANEPDVKRYQTTPYFYIDHAPTRVRCIFLSNPDNVTGDTTYWGFSQRELDWLSNDALDVPDGYSVLFFTHIPPVSGYADSAANLASFATLCTNFNATHTGRVLGVICGHEHIDLVIPVGWTYTGGFSNTLPCPIIILGTNYYNLGTTDREGKWGGIIYGRNVGTATEDLWTILVYTPDDVNHKLHFIRFGAGADVDV